MSSECLKIRQIGESGHSYLKLEGTVLIYQQKTWGNESKLLIPIELIAVSEHSRFYKDLLILALIMPILILVVLTLFTWFDGEPTFIDSGGMLFEIIGVTVLLEFCLLFALIFNFLFPKKTICLSYSYNNPDIDSEDALENEFKIEFWKTGKNVKQIDSLLEKIQQIQNKIGGDSNLETQPAKVLGMRNTSRFGKYFSLWLLFCMPAVLFQKYSLLSISLIPMTGYFISSFKLMRQPKEFRKALKKIHRKKFGNAIELLINLHKRLPEYLPAIYLLIDTYIKAEKFDEALSFIDTVPENYFQDINAVRLNIWKWKRINKRRFKSV